jgi:hypothetical protein
MVVNFDPIVPLTPELYENFSDCCFVNGTDTVAPIREFC